jgi:hypothetical protein
MSGGECLREVSEDFAKFARKDLRNHGFPTVFGKSVVLVGGHSYETEWDDQPSSRKEDHTR